MHECEIGTAVVDCGFNCIKQRLAPAGQQMAALKSTRLTNQVIYTNNVAVNSESNC
jgi:hypothetical protein